MQCYVHAGRPASGACVSCGNLICDECTVSIQNRRQCKRCLESGQASLSPMVMNPMPQPISINVVNSNNATSQAFGGGFVAYDSRRMHWVYFSLIGWWLGLMIASLIFPLLTESGRRSTAAAFGYW